MRMLTDVQTLLKDRLTEIENETGRLERALKHMDGSTRSKSRRRSSPRTVKSQARRAPRGKRAKQFVDFVAKNPDTRGSEIAKSLGIQASQVSQLGSRLEKQCLVEKTKSGYRLKA